MFTEEQLKEMRETANKNEKDQIFWKEADGTTKLLKDASIEELTRWKKHCESMLQSNNPKKLGKVLIYEEISRQKDLCNAELFVRYITSIENLQQSKFSLGNAFVDFIANNMHIENIENQSISIMFDNIDPTFIPVKIKDARNSCLNQLGVFKKYFTTKFVYGLGVWINAKDSKELNLNKKTSPKEKLDTLKIQCGIPVDTFLRLNPNGLSLTEFKTALNIRNKNYSALTTKELTLLRDKLLNNYQLTLAKQIAMWNNMLSNIVYYLNEKRADN